MNRLLTAALAVLAFAGCNRPEEQFMTPAQTTLAGPARPALDLEIPAKLETATFAVG